MERWITWRAQGPAVFLLVDYLRSGGGGGARVEIPKGCHSLDQRNKLHRGSLPELTPSNCADRTGLNAADGRRQAVNKTKRNVTCLLPVRLSWHAHTSTGQSAAEYHPGV